MWSHSYHVCHTGRWAWLCCLGNLPVRNHCVNRMAAILFQSGHLIAHKNGSYIHPKMNWFALQDTHTHTYTHTHTHTHTHKHTHTHTHTENMQLTNEIICTQAVGDVLSVCVCVLEPSSVMHRKPTIRSPLRVGYNCVTQL